MYVCRYYIVPTGHSGEGFEFDLGNVTQPRVGAVPPWLAGLPSSQRVTLHHIIYIRCTLLEPELPMQSPRLGPPLLLLPANDDVKGLNRVWGRVTLLAAHVVEL